MASSLSAPHPTPTAAFTIAPIAMSRRMLQGLTTRSAAAKPFADHFKVPAEEILVLRDKNGAVLAGKKGVVEVIEFPEESFLPTAEGEEEGAVPTPTSANSITPLGMGRKLLQSLSEDEGARRAFAQYFETEPKEIVVFRDAKGAILGGTRERVGGLGIFGGEGTE
ncbi:hypothetical protein IAT38_004632 [Cryptococcus sp. DSM 104549]